MHLGTHLLIFALLMLTASIAMHLMGLRGNRAALRYSSPVFLVSGLAAALSAGMLLWAFIANDFSLTYVYNNSSRDLPVIYKISAFWAGQEGSFLLWLLFLYIIGSVMLRVEKQNRAILMTVISITQFFILTILIAKSPFLRLWESYPESFAAAAIPPGLDGAGLNRLLQDPWMAVHPPVLLLGYAAATVPFAWAIAALIRNDYRIMAARAYRWTVITMLTLGTGIILGGYWAYAVLGWGGYWGWDSVENSSLIPWLLVIALLHGLIVQKRKNALVKTNLVLAVLVFASVFASTFLTRSGLLANFSVHSFGANGIAFRIIYFVVFILAVGIPLIAVRRNSIPSTPLGEKMLDGSSLISLWIALLIVYAALIMLGTIMPVITGLISPRPSTVTEKYYNLFSIPFALIMTLLISLATINKTSSRFSWRTLVPITLAAPVIAALIGIGRPWNSVAFLIAAAAIFTGAAVIFDFARHRSIAGLAPALSHAGTVILVVGIIASGVYTYSSQRTLSLNREERIGGVGITFRGFFEDRESKLKFSVADGKRVREFTVPYFFNERMNGWYKEPHIMSGVARDIYLSPVAYTSGLESVSHLELKEGEAKQIGDLAVKFNGFKKVDMKEMMAGKVTVFAELDVTRKGNTRAVSPGLSMRRDGQVAGIDAAVPGSARAISLRHISRETGKIVLFVEPAPDARIPADSVIVDISFKRLIVLVWIGTVLITVGTAIPLRRAA